MNQCHVCHTSISVMCVTHESVSCVSHMNQSEMSHMNQCHVCHTWMSVRCHTWIRAMIHTWMSHMNVTHECHIWIWVTNQCHMYDDMCAMTHSCVRHNSCIRAMTHVTHEHESRISVICTMTHSNVFHMNMWHASSLSVALHFLHDLSQHRMCDITLAYVPWLILVYSLKQAEIHYKGEAQKKKMREEKNIHWWWRQLHGLLFWTGRIIIQGGWHGKKKNLNLVVHVAAKSWHHGFTGGQNKFYENLQGTRQGEKKKIVLRWTIWRQETTSWFGHSSHSSAEQVL